MRFRRFLYLDASMTDAFLAQAEGGVFDEENQTEKSSAQRKAGVGAKAGVLKAEGSRGSDDETMASRTVRQTPDAAFARLAGRLEVEESLQYLDAFDENIFRQLRRGEMLEVECQIAVPVLVQFGLLVHTMDVPDLLSAFGEQLDPDAAEAIEGLSMLTSLLQAIPVIGHAAGAPRFKFIANLDPEYLRVGLDDVKGEATIMGTLERKLKPSEKWSVLDTMGLGMIPAKERREIEKGLRGVKELRDSVVSPPGAVISPVAIYR